MEVQEKLQELTGKKKIKLVESGDHAILSVLKFLKSIGKEKVLIQDQGGWLTYRDYPKKAGLEKVELKTDYGIIDISDLKEKADEKSVLLVNSLNGYFSEQPMEEITEICAEKKCLLVNDASGSIGTELAQIGDIIIGSFGKDKPVNLHYGGFIAFDEDYSFEGEFDSAKLAALDEELDKLFARQLRWNGMHWKIKADLKDFDIIHKEKTGINVIVKFKDEKEKEKIIKYCDENKLPYTICPRYIRVNCDAVSIEVKRT
ncbi:DegT/DnrJ/EryC1/StrS family aminotransferase [Candidatus Woesearchaeota archaeon]|nr:DegT/DnrJ/EryC1/StrS family aminotransferase [Candidatus Woesearchaeota archaeon]